MKKQLINALVCMLLLTEVSYAQTALDFDGSNDYVTSPATLNQNDNFTLEAYAQWRTNIDLYQTLVGFGSAVEIKGHDGDITYLSENGTSTRIDVPLVDGQWYHFAVVRDAGIWKFYVDGISYNMSQRPAPTPEASDTFRIGGRGTSENWNGAVEEVRVWTVARTQEEIQKNMNSCVKGNEAGLYLYYRLDDGTGSSSVRDLTANANHGTLNNMDINSAWLSGVGIECAEDQTCFPIKANEGKVAVICL